MKKIYISAMAAFVATSVSVVSVFAAVGSSITAKTDKKEISYTYKAGDNNEAKMDASKLFGDFRNVSKDAFSTENFTITCKTQNGSNIEVALLVETEKVAEGYSPLDYYSFVVTANDGEVLYDSATAKASDVAAKSKEIPLGKFNSHYTTDTKTFKVDYKINNDVASKIDEDTLSGVRVYVASHLIKPGQTAANASAAGENEYTVEVATSAPEEVVAAASTATAVPTAAPAEATAVPETATVAPSKGNETVEINGVKKICGKDITAGRYLVSGNGIVRIEGADGTLKSETTVSDAMNKGAGGVSTFYATIVDGDVITAMPLPGKDKPSVKFTKTTPATTTTTAAPKTPSSGTSNIAASSAGAANKAVSVTPKPAATRATAAPSKAKTDSTAAKKANPKTGEDNTIAWLYGLMAVMAVGVVALEIFKRKKVN